MRAFHWFICTQLLSPLLVLAQTTPPAAIALKSDEARVWEHWIGPAEVLHRSQQEMDALAASNNPRVRFGDGMGECSFTVVVSAAGLVESATLKPTQSPLGSCSPHEQEAEPVIRARRYQPWLVDGRPVRVAIEDSVIIYAPERWGPQVAFPEKIDRSTLEFKLQRTNCFGNCPAYTVSIKGDGAVGFDGGLGTALTGHHTAHIGRSAVDSLTDQFRAANFLSAMPSYHSHWTDNPTQTLTLSINGQTKKVVDYDGLRDGLPQAIRELEAAVDQAADTERWVSGKGDLLAVLNREQWDFAASSAENQSLYVQAITLGNQPLIQAFLAAHAPALAAIGNSAPPVCVASRIGSLSLVREMLRSGDKVAPEVKDRCLVNAAISGDTEMLNFWLDQGADPRAKAQYAHNGNDPESWMEQQGLLVNAVESGNAELLEKVLSFKFDVNRKFQNESLVWWAIARVRDGRKTAEVVELLLEAGADPNVRDTQRVDTTPLFECGLKPEVIEPLVRAGADVNARDRNGTTPLIRNAFIEPFVRELLAHGADPSLVNERGDTALSVANRNQCRACAELVQQALNRQSGAAAKLN